MRVIRPGESVDVAFEVTNDGLRVGSVYLTLRVASPYSRKTAAFDSHRSLAFNDRQSWRLMDMAPGQKATFLASWQTAKDLAPGAYYFDAAVWNIPTVMRPGNAPRLRYRDFCFSRLGLIPGIEVVDFTGASSPDAGTMPMKKPIKAFISYSWDSDSHQEWVLALADELVKNGVHVIMDRRDLLAGEEITLFIERSISAADILILVCSANYVKKANERIGGVGMETVISSSVFLQARATKTFIPILKDNDNPPETRLPYYLGSTLYVDMRHPDWRGAPLHELLRALKQ
ncbi:MAG: toll/interleukin-1 receptor domain-containing protein [Opitutaceae bacterium]